jgi:DNA-binding response OmpR family regulator
MFSAHTAPDKIFSQCKADDFIEKPFDVNHLLTKINYQMNAAKHKTLVEGVLN